ncbi:hypothetical protein CDL12_14003 [Handroanthus impetiginosus]|uniref:Uncharacterized protein n=1 Tax=Handroanthus impetiginosus TaxID=429701 RepID=A0A2G9H783_9LAMI|nr:hypothetical protein CDL12_14003 [Handroanthus impetiginosus]
MFIFGSVTNTLVRLRFLTLLFVFLNLMVVVSVLVFLMLIGYVIFEFQLIDLDMVLIFC